MPTIFVIFALAAAIEARAATPDVYDNDVALAAASKFAAERSARRARISPARGLERFYHVGDLWRVSFEGVSHGMVFKNDASAAHADRALEPELFDFRVVEVSDGIARVEVVGASGRHARFSIDSKFQVVAADAGLPFGFGAFPVETAGDGGPIDLLERAVDFKWNPGDLWPSYVKNGAGIARLVSQEKK